MAGTTHISWSDLEDLMQRALVAEGVPVAAARSVAGALASAQAEGQSGHGISRLSDYVAQVRTGKINRDARIRIDVAGVSSLRVDADHGFAFPALDAALEAGLPMAQETGIAVMAIRKSHHCGALSLQVERIAEAGLIGLMVANAPKAIAPWGAKDAVFGTNPIAFATPQGDGPPLVIDLSLSRVARGKVMAAKKAGTTIPEGWALGPDGEPTTDPEAALAGTMLPIGGAKGTALALMVEVLAAAFSGANFSLEASSFFDADGAPPGVGQTLIAIRPGPDSGFPERVSFLLNAIATSPGARLPGNRRLSARAAALANGLDVPTPFIEYARGLVDAG